MAEGGYGGQGSSQWTSVSDHERHKSAPGHELCRQLLVLLALAR